MREKAEAKKYAAAFGGDASAAATPNAPPKKPAS